MEQINDKNVVRVLCLNDDNHGGWFISKEQIFGNVINFIKTLMKSHDVDYQVRSIYICEIPEGLSEAIDKPIIHEMDWGTWEEDPLDEAFDMLSSCNKNGYDLDHWNAMFDLFWEYGENYIAL